MTSWGLAVHGSRTVRAPQYSFAHKGVHFVTLMSVNEKDFWTQRKMTPQQRMQTVAGLDNGVQSRFEVGAAGRDWLKNDGRFDFGGSAAGLADSIYNLWDRNPVTVRASYLASNGSKDLPAATKLTSY